MKKRHFIWVLFFCSLVPFEQVWGQQTPGMHLAPAPLYRDPIYDGPADPVVFYNRMERDWWMLYTQRRANMDAPDVAYCYGTAIGIASSGDHGNTWVYRGALHLEVENGVNTFWAPDVVFYQGSYHLFVAYIRGVRSHWGGNPRIAHYTGKDLWHWKFEGFVPLSSQNVIDPALFQRPDGTWLMWYKDQDRGSAIMVASSKDLYHWVLQDSPAINGHQEGPVVFGFQGSYWMLTDEWAGMRVYKSTDLMHWEKQGRILSGASQRAQDGPSGAHGDVVVLGDKAYVFYFTHPGRKKHTEAPLDKNGVLPYALRRSCIQVAPLRVANGTLVCDREVPFDFWLEDPE